MALSDYVHTFGQYMLQQHGERVHKIALDADFSCPNRDGTKGIGGCTFCNNASFSPNGRTPPTLATQINGGKCAIGKRTRARRFLAYFQAYTNTYADVAQLKILYDQALQHPDVIGLSIGTRPDCVPDVVLDLLASYRDRGFEIWLELGLQSSFDDTLLRINRGHDYQAYVDAVKRIHARNINLCTHLIVGLPGEELAHNMITLDRVLEQKTHGLKLHPLHVVKGTQLANEWRRGEYQPLTLDEYIDTAVTMIRHTPSDIIFHRVTATASLDILLAPMWCNKKWLVLNSIAERLNSVSCRAQ